MKDLIRWEPALVNEAWGVCAEGTRDLVQPKWLITPQTTLTPSDVALICAAHNARVTKGGTGSIDVASLVNRELEPIVQVTLGAESAQLGVREARQHVSQLYEAIEASLSDALLVRFIRDEIFAGKTDNEAELDHAVGQILTAFRKFRASFEAPIESEKEN